MKRISFMIFTLVSINCFGQQYSTSWEDLDYAGDAMVYRKLDIYLPEVQKLSYPAVVVIYGSAWFANNLKGTVLQTLGQPYPFFHRALDKFTKISHKQVLIWNYIRHYVVDGKKLWQITIEEG